MILFHDILESYHKVLFTFATELGINLSTRTSRKKKLKLGKNIIRLWKFQGSFFGLQLAHFSMQKIFRQYHRSSDVFFLCNELLSQVKKDGRLTTGLGRLLFELFEDSRKNLRKMLIISINCLLFICFTLWLLNPVKTIPLA